VPQVGYEFACLRPGKTERGRVPVPDLGLRETASSDTWRSDVRTCRWQRRLSHSGCVRRGGGPVCAGERGAV